MARILAKAMNCIQGPTDKPCQVCRSCLEITSGNSADVNEIDGASKNRVNQVRELRNGSKFLPIYSRYKIIIIDEVHMLSPEAFSALLKIIEEPPAHIIFVFATTELQEIPITVLSRCQRHDFRRIAASALKRHMQWICDKEQVGIDEESLTLIAREANGSMRDAVALLEHILTFLEGQVKLSDVTKLLGVVERRYLFKLSTAILAYNIQDVLRLIDGVWCAGYEIIRFYDDLTIHFYQLFLVKIEAKPWRKIDLPIHDIEQMKTQVKQADVMFLLQVLDLLLKAEQTIKMSTQPKLALEMTLLKIMRTPKAMSIEVLIDRLDRLYAG
jgi:DNA polymerase-3 subunit gamma/tau